MSGKESYEQVPSGIWKHFKGGEYLVLGVREDRAQSGKMCDFVYYIPLYSDSKEFLYRRLLHGIEEGEEDGWLLPVDKETYKGPRFTLLEKLSPEEITKRIHG
jgi:hypothetical protein